MLPPLDACTLVHSILTHPNMSQEVKMRAQTFLLTPSLGRSLPTAQTLVTCGRGTYLHKCPSLMKHPQ